LQSGALGGIKVLDCTHYITGPYCTKLLAELGAEVIKVENPRGGDQARRVGPFFKGKDIPIYERSGLFFYLNTNKKGITLDLKQRTGKEIFKRLTKETDIVVENFSPRVMPSLGLSYDTFKQINPSLVMTSISNFGQSGPYRDWKSSELVSLSLGGLSYSSYGAPGRSLVKPYGSMVQHMTGVFAAVATMIALYHQRRTGVGQHIDVSIMDYAASIEEHSIPMAAYQGRIRERSSRHPTAHPNIVFPCKDGYMHVAVTGARQWQTLCALAQFPSGWSTDSSFLNGEYRLEHADEIDAILAPWLMLHTKEELQKMSFDLMLASAPIKTVAEVIGDKQHKSRGFFIEAEHPHAGKVTIPGMPFKMGGHQCMVARAPLLGESNEEVYCQHLGYSKGDLVRLRQQGVI